MAPRDQALGDPRYKKFEEVVTRFYQDGVCGAPFVEGELALHAMAHPALSGVLVVYGDGGGSLRGLNVEEVMCPNGWPQVHPRTPTAAAVGPAGPSRGSAASVLLSRRESRGGGADRRLQLFSLVCFVLTEMKPHTHYYVEVGNS